MRVSSEVTPFLEKYEIHLTCTLLQCKTRLHWKRWGMKKGIFFTQKQHYI